MKLWNMEECQWGLSATLNDFKLNRGKTSDNGFRRKVSQKYSDALQRCNNPNHKLYPHYGQRGIKVEISKEEFFDWFLKEYKGFFSKHGTSRPSLSRKRYDEGYKLNNLELTTVDQNTRELYGRRGNRSPRGTVLDDIQVLVCHTYPDKNILDKVYGVTYQAIRAIQTGKNFPRIFSALRGGEAL